MLSNHPNALGGNTGSSGSGPGGSVAASDVSVADAGGYYTGTNAESVLQEVGAELDALNTEQPSSPTGNRLVRGGNVAADGGLVIVAGAATYIIQGTTYTSAQTSLTAAAADPTNPRIDVVAVNSSGNAVLITGTAAATPLKPDVDPTTQLELTFVLVAAAATAVTANIVDVYRENVEYTMTKSGTSINLASTSNPRSGTTDIEGTAVPAGDYFRAQAPGTLNLADYDNLIFFIRSKASWPNAKQLSITARSSGTIVGQTVVLKNGTYGFDSSVTGSYQLITIPTSLFGANGQAVNQLQWTCAGGGSTIGFYVDDISLQGGVAAVTDSSRMLWRGNYSSTVLYNINDVVLGADGIQYVSIQSGQGKTPASNPTYWQASSAAGGSGTLTLARFSPLSNNPPSSNYAPLLYRNSIPILSFDESVAQSAIFSSTIPEGADFTTGISVIIKWVSASATSGACVWTSAFERGNTDIDSDSFATAVSATTTTGATSGVPNTTTINHSGSEIDGVVAGDFFRVKIARDTASGSDTMAGAAQIISIEIRQR